MVPAAEAWSTWPWVSSTLVTLMPCSSIACFKQVEVAAGIDGGAFHGLVIPDDGAILLERRDGRDHDLEHDCDVMA